MEYDWNDSSTRFVVLWKTGRTVDYWHLREKSSNEELTILDGRKKNEHGWKWLEFDAFCVAGKCETFVMKSTT